MKALIIVDMQEITMGRNHAQMFSYDKQSSYCEYCALPKFADFGKE